MTFDVLGLVDDQRRSTPRTPRSRSSWAATTLGTSTLDNTAQAALPGFDVTGKASVDVVLPPGTRRRERRR